MRPRLAVILAAAGGLVMAVVAACWVLSAPRPSFTGARAAALDRMAGDSARGRLVFTAADCASCHATPGQRDEHRLGGGLELASPYGTLRAPNLSPDARDGIGRWRASDLANALVSGVSPTGDHYYPAFPYTSFTYMEPQDIVDLMAYLQTLPPVAERPPGHRLVFPFNVRRAIGLWKMLYLHPGPLEASEGPPGKPVAWLRGRYLAEAQGHCVECHSARNMLGAVESDTRYAGGRDPEGTGFVPNITPTGIGSWRQEQLVEALIHGKTPDGRTLGSSMAGVVKNLSALPPEDVEAIAIYVKSLPPRPTSTP